MADNDQTGGLPTTEDAVAKYGAKGNLSIAGQKGVSLEGAQSADIRERLMQMIAARERGNPMDEAMGHLALATSEQSGFAKNYHDYLARKRQQEQDLLGMHVSVGQLASEEQRLKREAQEQQLIREQIYGTRQPVPSGGGLFPTQGAETMGFNAAPAEAGAPTGGLGMRAPTQQGPGMQGQPAGGLSAVRPQNAFATQQDQIASLFDTMGPEEKSAFYGMGKNASTRGDYYKKLQERAAPTVLERELQAAGLSPEDRRAGIMASRLGEALKEVKTYNPATGYENPVPTNTLDIARQRLGLGQQQPAAAAPQPTGSAQAPAPQPTGSTQAPVNYSIASGTPSEFGTNPFPFGTEAWKKRNAELSTAQTEVAVGSEKELNTAANKQLEAINTMRDPSLQVSKKIDAVLPNISKYPEIFGSQSQPGKISMFVNALADKGKPFDQVIASLLESSQFPEGSKKYREARETLIATKGIFDELTALRAKEMFGGGQGQTDKDMQVAKNIIGDPRRLNDKTIVSALKVMRDGINFKNQMADVYNERRANGSTMSYAQFLRSNEYRAAEAEKAKEYSRHMSVLTASDTTPVEPGRDFSKPSVKTDKPMTPDELAALRKRTAERFGVKQ